jgi:hypothetical protein
LSGEKGSIEMIIIINHHRETRDLKTAGWLSKEASELLAPPVPTIHEHGGAPTNAHDKR